MVKYNQRIEKKTLQDSFTCRLLVLLPYWTKYHCYTKYNWPWTEYAKRLSLNFTVEHFFNFNTLLRHYYFIHHFLKFYVIMQAFAILIYSLCEVTDGTNTKCLSMFFSWTLQITYICVVDNTRIGLILFCPYSNNVYLWVGWTY